MSNKCSHMLAHVCILLHNHCARSVQALAARTCHTPWRSGTSPRAASTHTEGQSASAWTARRTAAWAVWVGCTQRSGAAVGAGQTEGRT
eukprot:1145510-Pelagomonas_calceolata.AAC.6